MQLASPSFLRVRGHANDNLRAQTTCFFFFVLTKGLLTKANRSDTAHPILDFCIGDKAKTCRSKGI